MKLSKIIGFIVILSMIACVSVSAVSAAVDVSIDNATVDNSNTITVNITAHDVTELGIFGIKLEYNTSVVSVTNVQNNPEIPDNLGVSETDDDGSLSLVSSGFTTPSLTGTEVLLLTVTLEAVGDAGDESDLNITVSVLKHNNGTAIDATDVDGTFRIAPGAAAPTCTVSVTNATIVPPQTTDITVTFSEKVQYTLNIETSDGTVVSDWIGNRKASRMVAWNGTYETNGTQVPDGTYTVNLTVTNETTVLSGNNRTETIVVSPGDDTIPPVITDVACDTPTTDSVNITWTTDEGSDSLVKYGTESGAYTAEVPDATMTTSHSIMLTGLDADTDYYFVVNSTDASDNSGESAESSFKTAATSDTTPPTITDVACDPPTTDSVNITWTTDEGSDSLVKYGTESGAYTAEVPDATMTTSHSIMLTGLDADTDYYFVVNSTDASDNSGESAESSFKTAATSDTIPPVITDVACDTPTTDSVNITWTTDEGSDSLVKYGTVSGTYTAEVPDATMTTSHSIMLTGLDADTDYYFVVNSTDASDNSGESAESSFKTAATSDTTPPTITDVACDTPTTDSVNITWTTDEGSDSLVKYGTVSGTYTAEVSDAAMTTSHSIMLTGLDADTDYYFVVNSTDASDNSGESAESSFRTATPTVSGTYVSIDNATVDTSNTITVNITAHDVTELGIFGIKLEYNTSVVSVTNVQNNPEIPDNLGVSETDDDGSLSLVSSGFTTPSLTGTEVLLLTVTLEAVGDAGDESDLNITVSVLKHNNGTAIDATDVDGTFRIAPGAAAPTCTVSVTNATIVPPQTTDITVTFSEKVQYTLNIETSDGTVVSDWIGNRKASRTVAWNGTYETNGTQVPDGTYTVNLTVTNETTVLSGNNRTETIVVSPGDDTIPPVITDVACDTPTTDSVNITWTTDEGSDSLVKYGTVSGTYTAEVPDATMTTSHSIMLTGLDADTDYYFVVNSTDASDNSGESAESSFKTAATSDTTPPTITDVACDTPTTDSVNITWTTDEGSDSLVKYGTVSGTYTAEVSDAAMTTSHSIMLTGLDADTDYYFVVNSTDASDNSGESAESSFRTATPTVSGTYVSIDNATVDTSNTITVNITAHDVTELGIFGIKLEYNTSVVSVTNVQNNPEIPDNLGVSETDDDGSLSLVSSGFTTPSLTGTEVLLLTVTLEAVGDAGDESDLNITVSVLKHNNGTAIDATDVDGTFRIAPGAAAPTCTVSVTNATIVPPQTTDITVTFSEKVQYTLNIETSDGTVVSDWIGNRKASRTVAWNGTYETNGTQVPDGTYTVNLTVTNETTVLSGNNRTETIVVSPGDDTIPPVITDVACDTPTTDSVNITWTTDEGSDSLVKYGTVSGIYTAEVSDAAMTTSHSIMLTGLDADMDYYFVVNSTDASDNSGESDESSFKTAATSDTIPPVITDVACDTPTTDSVNITWTTDEGSDSLVKYGTESGTYTAEVPDATMTTSHSIMLTGLDADTDYYFVVNSTDASDNSGESAESSFKTAATSDTTPPTITDVACDTPTTDSVNITWTTDEGSDSLVKYGTVSGTYTAEVSDAAMTTSHSIMLTGLDADTDYYFVVNSTDASDNSGESAEHNFTTAMIATSPMDVTADPTSVLKDIATNVLFNVTSEGAPVDGALVTLLGCGVDTNGTTVADGTVIISVTANSTGAIDVTATKNGYEDAATTITVNGPESSGNNTTPVISDFVNVTGNYTGTAYVQALGDPIGEVGTTIGLGDGMMPFKGANVTIDQSLDAGEWVRIEMNYTDDELGDIDEDGLEIYKFNKTAGVSGEWELVKEQQYCIDQDKNKADNYLWVKVDELSIFTRAGKEKVPPTSTPTTTTGGGGGSGTYPPNWDDDAPAPTPAATTAPTDAAPEPTVASTEAPTDEASTEAPTDEAPTETPTTGTEMKTPGFGAVSTVFAIAGLLVATYLVMRRRE